MKTVPITTTRRGRPACLPMRNDYSPICNNANITAQVRPSLHRGEQSPQKGEYHGKQGRHAGLPQRHAPNGYKTHHLEQPHFGCCNGRCRQRPYGWALGLVLCFLLVLGCSNPYERDNPTDPVHVYKITFNASDATGGTPPAVVTGSYGDRVTLPDGGSLVRSGYAFGNWTDPDNSRYSAGSQYTIKGDVAMNVNWLTVYTATFDGNGATSGTAPAAMTTTSNYLLPDAGSLQRTGYVFAGWTNNSSGTGTVYKAGSSLSASHITLYAAWAPIRTVTFDVNDATNGTPPTAMKEGSGFLIKLPGQGNLEKDGHLFVGWNANSSGEGTSFKADSSYLVADDITLYAIFGVPCTVTFNANGGSPAPSDITVGSGDIISLPLITRSGYGFNGWSSEAGDNYNGGSSFTVTSDVSLSARWSTLPPGSIRVSNTSGRGGSIIKLRVESTSGSWSKNFGTGNSAFITPGSSYTVSDVPVGSYIVMATYYSGTYNSGVTVSSGSVASVTF